MPYSQISFLAIRQQLAERLNDESNVFFVDAELKIYIQDALRFWNILTGDNKKLYSLTTNPATVWYDLNTFAGSPRLATIKDTDIFSRLQYILLEPQAAQAAVTTAQFTSDDLIQAVQRKRDEFLFRTGCTSSIETFPLTANTPTITLPQTVIQARRAYWLPNTIAGVTPNPFPLPKTDEFTTASYQATAPSTPGQPNTFSSTMEPPLTIEITPPPNQDGSVEVLTIESQALLSPLQATTLLIPSDFAPGLVWGALADLMSMNLETKDSTREAVARKRFDEYVELMKAYPFIFSARVGNIPIYVDAVEVLDLYSPQWRTTAASPSIIGLSGQNLLAYPTTAIQQIILSLLANANIPIADADNIQLGDEVIDVVLDEAQFNASFKMGGQECLETIKLHTNMIKLAAQRNAKIKALSFYKEIMYERSQREMRFAPLEAQDDSEG